MATNQMRTTARVMMAPSVILLLIWMVVPLAARSIILFRTIRCSIPSSRFAGWDNYYYFLTDPAFSSAILNTILLVGGSLLITVVGGLFLAMLIDQPIFGQGIVRILVISPFFVMPTVAALVWKNMLMNPIYGIFAWLFTLVGLHPVDFLAQIPLLSIIMIVSWQWLPFATLILLTALQSLDSEQQEAAEMDGAGVVDRFIHLVLPHLARAITVVILIESIFLLGIFAEILVTTNGGPGTASTNLPFLVYQQALLNFDVGGASAGGIVAVVLANIVAFFLMRIIGKNLEA